MRHQRGTGNQIIEGVIWKQLLLFFFPILLGTFFQQFYNTVDSVIVGRFVGKEALASVGGSAGQIINLVVGFFTGLCAGAGVIISQFYGAQDSKGLNDSIHTAYAFSLAGSVVITILGVVMSPSILEMMNTPPELIDQSSLYLRIYFAGIVFVFIYNIGSGILRALGDSKRPLYYLIICCLLNVVLDLVMVLVFHLGIAGVAIATLIAQAVSSVLVTIALMKSNDIYKLKLQNIRFHGRVLKSQLYIGLPGGFQSTMYNLSNIIIQAAINVYGTDTTAAWAAYGKLDAIFWMVSGAFGVSITTFVGQNYGAGKYDRIKKSVRICLGMDLVVSVALTLFLILFRYPLFQIFTDDKEVIRIGADMLKLITPCYVTFIFIEVLSGALRGISDVIIPMLLTLFGVCLLRIAWIFFVVPMNPSIHTVIFNYPVTWITTSILFIIYYMYKKRSLKAPSGN
ncbi:MAG: MATE family efflux transporter [Eubacteriales bacterium]|nr:MATE family efflux transporter [Eubacteriales bacterium]